MSKTTPQSKTEANLQSSTHHKLKKGDVLKLHNEYFPYPPFTYYKWNKPEGVKVEETTHIRNPGYDGGTNDEYVTFTFENAGTYDIILTIVSSADAKLFKVTVE